MKRNLHLGPAALALVGFGLLGALLWSGSVPCLAARWLHVPCPGCGSTRSVRALLTFDFHDVLRFNPLGPVMAALFGLFVLRTLYVTARDGHVHALTQGRFGSALPWAMLATYGCEVVLWALRFFGLFGGPCPV
jgi:hypothetical protein